MKKPQNIIKMYLMAPLKVFFRTMAAILLAKPPWAF